MYDGQIVREKKYTTDHEWIELSDDGATGTLHPPTPLRIPLPSRTALKPPTGTIGISTYAAHSLGDVVYVELPTPDLTVSAGDSIGAVESVKSASDIMTPVAGTIIEANSLLEEKPGTINKGPEGEGWIARIKLEGQEERERVGGLMGGDEYRKFTEE